MYLTLLETKPYATCEVNIHWASLLQVLKLGYIFFHFNDATLKHCNSHRLCDGNYINSIKCCNFASNYLHDRCLLMSRQIGILLFNSRGTCTRCLGSRRRFNVNTGFTDDNRILIENLYILKVTVQKKRIKEFPNKGWALSSLNKLLNYLSILPVCFASFFLASRHVIA